MSQIRRGTDHLRQRRTTNIYLIDSLALLRKSRLQSEFVGLHVFCRFAHSGLIIHLCGFYAPLFGFHVGTAIQGPIKSEIHVLVRASRNRYPQYKATRETLEDELTYKALES